MPPFVTLHGWLLSGQLCPASQRKEALFCSLGSLIPAFESSAVLAVGVEGRRAAKGPGFWDLVPARLVLPPLNNKLTSGCLSNVPSPQAYPRLIALPKEGLFRLRVRGHPNKSALMLPS